MRQRPGRQAQAHAEREAETEQDTANTKGGPQGRDPQAQGQVGAGGERCRAKGSRAGAEVAA